MFSHCYNDKGLLIFTMGGIGQNLQLLSDGSEISTAIRAPHTTYAYTKFVTKYVIFCELWGKISVPDIKNLGLAQNLLREKNPNERNI